jgi:hypothetical protein
VVVEVVMLVHSQHSRMMMMNHLYYPNANVYVNVSEYEHDYVFH